MMMMMMRKKLGFMNFNAWKSKRWIETVAFEEIRASPNINNNNNNNNNPISTAFIIHGLLGSSRNWRSFARNLASYLSSHSSNEWRLVLVDLRNHGSSAHLQGLHPPHNLHNAASDLANLIKSQGWGSPRVVIGHSLGGKVALHFLKTAHSTALPLPKQLWVLDSVPGVINPENSTGEVEKVLETLQTLPSPIPSRKWLVDHMTKLGFSNSLSQWLGTNLKKSNDHQIWAFNLDGAYQMFNSYREEDYWPVLEHPPRGTEISIVRAENSDRWEPHVIQRLEMLANKEQHGSQGKLSLHVLPKAGHWVHVDNPKGLLDIIAPRIASLD